MWLAANLMLHLLAVDTNLYVASKREMSDGPVQNDGLPAWLYHYQDTAMKASASTFGTVL